MMISKKIKTLFVTTMFTTSLLMAQLTFAHEQDIPVMPEEGAYPNQTFYDETEDSIMERVTMYRVNLRTGASTDHERLIVVPEGETVYVVHYAPEGWSQVLYNEYIGYIKSEFLQTTLPQIQTIQYEQQVQVSSDSSNGVELSTWTEIRNVFTVGVPAAVYDIQTGRTYYVKSFSNGQHADVEPVTAEDTAIMKETFGGVWSWAVRPVWVTINGRTFAGSINGMPHGGGVNPSNNMNGQVCIHFLHSSTHNNNSDFTRLHQDILKKAFDFAQNR